jgi:putative aldouronate transport system permease protein
MSARWRRLEPFDVANIALLGLVAAACLFPFLYVLLMSVTPYADYLADPMKLIPKRIDFAAYRQVFRFSLIYSGYRVTLFITIVGTTMNVLLLLITAYPLSKTELRGRKLVFTYILITLFFNGGLIPNYFLIRNLGLLNTAWSIILSGAISPVYLILMVNFFRNLPDSLEESALMDGANPIRILFSILVPLSRAPIATFVLFYAVWKWNTFFLALIYITRRSLWPLMVILREMVVEQGVEMIGEGEAMAAELQTPPFTLKMAVIIITILPILVVYPVIQRYFVRGMLIGAVKG